MAAESHSLSINPNAETKWILLCINTIRPEENGDVVRLQGEEVPGLLAPTFGSNSQIHNAVKPLTQNLQRRPAENSVQSVENNLNILGPRHNCRICCKQFLQILPGRSVGS